MRIVIALGGNAMTAPDGSARPADQQAAIEEAAGPMADLVADGHQLVITHGNGPQVGNLLVKNELAAAVVPPVPLDWCGAQTQATIGVLVMNALDAALAARGSAVRTTALISRTLVDGDDPGFAEPTQADRAIPVRGRGGRDDRTRPELAGSRKSRLASDGRLARAVGLPGCAGRRNLDRGRVRGGVFGRRRYSSGANRTAAVPRCRGCHRQGPDRGPVGGRVARRPPRHRYRRRATLLSALAAIIPNLSSASESPRCKSWPLPARSAAAAWRPRSARPVASSPATAAPQSSRR